MPDCSSSLCSVCFQIYFSRGIKLSSHGLNIKRNNTTVTIIILGASLAENESTEEQLGEQEAAGIQDPLYVQESISSSIQSEENHHLRPFSYHCGVKVELGTSKPWDRGTLRASPTAPSFIKSFI